MSKTPLSYWESQYFLQDIDFLIVGAGIVGSSTAYHLSLTHPNAKIVILDKAILSDAASFKNAGFACFGSPSELLDDLTHIPSSQVWQTVERRWKGLLALQNWLGKENIDLQTHGSWDLFKQNESEKSEQIADSLDDLNRSMYAVTGEKEVYSADHLYPKSLGMEGFDFAFRNTLEGQLNTRLLNQSIRSKLHERKIEVLRGIEVHKWDEQANGVVVHTDYGDFQSKNLILCTNGFSKDLLPSFDLEPARAQVLVTSVIPGLKILGTFHSECGYYYFRNIDNRVLFGGGRNLDFATENTSNFGQNTLILNQLKERLTKEIIPHHHNWSIEYSWSGIMGVGKSKQPIIETISPHVIAGIRMGGMGVAIGTQVGIELAALHK